MSFWESFNDAASNAIESMGEPVKATVDGDEIDAVILPMSGQSGMIPGGVKGSVDFQLLVAVAVKAPADGRVVVARGQTGRLNSWEYLSADFAVWTVGPSVRWNGEIPGV